MKKKKITFKDNNAEQFYEKLKLKYRFIFIIMTIFLCVNGYANIKLAIQYINSSNEFKSLTKEYKETHEEMNKIHDMGLKLIENEDYKVRLMREKYPFVMKDEIVISIPENKK